MEITVTVSQWGWDGGVFAGGRHTIDTPSRKLLAAVAAAEATGDVTVKASKDERAKMAKHVESDADSLKVQEKAMADGSWHLGNHEAFLTNAAIELANETLRPERRAHLLVGIEQSRDFLNRPVTDG